MTNFLKKNLAVILGATIVAGFVAMIDGGMVVRAEDACKVDITKQLEKDDLKNLTPDELLTCSEKIVEKQGEEIIACEQNPGNPCPENEKQQKNSDLVEVEYAAKSSTAPVKDYVKHVLNIKDISEDRCYDPTKPEEKYLQYATVIEEPIESDIIDNTKFRNCVRNTFCINRDDKPGTECVTFLRKAGEGGCSSDAREYTEKSEENKKNSSIYCQQVQLILSDSGTDLIYAYVGGLYRWAASVIGMIAVLVIVISGIQISAAAGDQQAVTNAKNRIFQSLGGLALLFLSGVILYTINPTFFTAG
jgi:hypothetical protein